MSIKVLKTRLNKLRVHKIIYGQLALRPYLIIQVRPSYIVAAAKWRMSWSLCSKEIKTTISRATGVMAEFSIIRNSKHMSIQTKLSIIRTCVMSVVLCVCETWALRKWDKDALLAFEMKWYRRILHIQWQQKATKKEIRSGVGTTKNIIGIMERKLNLFGHIWWMADTRLVNLV